MPSVQHSEASLPSSFDAHHPPEKKYIDDCVHCGFCLPACPTYVLWGNEMDSPRGRIYMIKKASEGEAPLDTRFRQHMDNCLGCMACVSACPSGVLYNKLIEPTRAQIERNTSRSLSDRLFRKLVFATFPYPERLRVLALPLMIYQRTRLNALINWFGIWRLLPRRLVALNALLPKLENVFEKLPATVHPRGTPRRRVGMLNGCIQQVFFSRVNAATARVLAAEGCEVVIPPEQGCCGALMLHSGLETDAIEFAKKLIAVFEKANVDTMVINSAGCGSTMKEYGYLLRDDPVWADRAVSFSAKCKDISEFLCELEPQALRNPLECRVAYHDACHLQHAQGVRDQPRRLLKAIPGLDVAEIPEAHLCCGSAGIYNLLEPETAQDLGDRKVSHLVSTHSQAVVSANPGCLLQLMSGAHRQGIGTMPAFHLVEVVDASIRGISAADLLKGDAASSLQTN